MNRTRPMVVLLLAVAIAPAFDGQVFDAHTRQPIAWAEVGLFGLGNPVLADEHGRFSIPTTAARVTVGASRVGYQPRTWLDLDPTEPAQLFLLPDVIRLDGVTVSAYRTPVSIDRSGPVTVFTRRQVEADGRTDLSDLVRSSLSAIARDNVNFTSVTLRGTNAEHTLIAIDGIRLNSAQNGTFDLTTMPVTFADRVELVRGGNSALYGTSSVGGMMNIITPDPAKLTARLRARMGSFGQRYLHLTHGNRVGRLGYALGTHYTAAANDFTWTDDSGVTARMPNADQVGIGAFAKSTYRAGPQRFDLFGEYNSTERGIPGSRTWPSDSARRDDVRGIAHFGYTFEPHENLRTTGRAYWHDSWQNFRDPAAFVPINDTHRLADYGLHIDQAIRPLGWLPVQAGLEADHSLLASTSVGDAERLAFAGWLQASAELAGFAVTPAARFERIREDHNPDSTPIRSTTDVLSPKLTLTWSDQSWLSIYAGAGRSFRAPTFNDRFWPEDMWSYGNPHLKPELSTNFDLGVRGTLGKQLSYWVGGYYSDLVDLIQWQPDSLFRYRPVNVAEATITGVELEAEYATKRLRARAGFNWSGARSDGERLLYRPQLTGRAQAWAHNDFGPVRIRVALGADYAGDRLTDAVFPDTVPATLPGFTLANVETSISPRFGRVFTTLRFGARNLFDQRYQTVDQYPTPGRSLYVELETGL